MLFFTTTLAVFLTALMAILMHPTVLWGWHVPDMGYLAWFFLVPFFIVILHKKNKKVFFISLLTSFLFLVGSLYWLVGAMEYYGELSWEISVLVLCLAAFILAVFFAGAIQIAFILSRKTKAPFFLAATVLLVSQDYLLTFLPMGGFPWVLPAYSQGLYLSFFQWIELTGVHGLNALIYLVNGLLAELIYYLILKNRDIFIRRIIYFCFIFICWVIVQLLMPPSLDMNQEGPSTQIALVQGNIAQDEKWDLNLVQDNLKSYTDLTRQAAIEGAHLAIWPETAYPYSVDGKEDQFVISPEELKIPVLTGSVTDTGKNIYNSAYLLGSDVKILGSYHKRHLVPFGEYVPLKDFLFFAHRLTIAVGDFDSGENGQNLILNELKMGLLICYEDIFPALSRASVLNGANLLVNLTNDAWYGNTSAQWQHLVFSQFRALENRRYLLRATNTGVTAVINPRGEILKQLEPFQAGVLMYPVKTVHSNTFYTRHGDYIAWVSVLFTLVLLGDAVFSKKKGDYNGQGIKRTY